MACGDGDGVGGALEIYDSNDVQLDLPGASASAATHSPPSLAIDLGDGDSSDSDTGKDVQLELPSSRC
jgi:hypothetical protein